MLLMTVKLSKKEPGDDTCPLGLVGDSPRPPGKTESCLQAQEDAVMELGTLFSTGRNAPFNQIS